MKTIDKIRAMLRVGEAAIILSPVSCRYLSGFNISDGVIVITASSAVLFADSRYIEAAKNSVKQLSVSLLKGYGSVKEFLEKEKIERAFIETEYLTLTNYNALIKALKISVSKDKKLSALLKKSRMIKTEAEIDSIIAAQKITDAAFSHILGYIKAGVSEREIMLELEFFMRKMGSEGVAFDTIAVAGKNSSLPHGEPTDYKLQKGDLLTLDFGAVINGYRSDMTRTVAIGEISDEKKRVYNTVLAAQKAAIENIAVGKKCSQIDKIARDYIENAGYKDLFGHALGHSVGLDIHEYPNLSPRCDEILCENMVLTVEPGVYIENEFGVRIENMIIVGKNGARVITNSPTELIIL